MTKGGLVRLLHRTADAAAPAYAKLREQVRCSPVVTPDETGWRVNAVRHWLWAFATPETTVYAICAGRGFGDAAAVLGPDFAGVLVRDGWVGYRGFKKASHQLCPAHLLRRCNDLQAAHPDSPRSSWSCFFRQRPPGCGRTLRAQPTLWQPRPSVTLHRTTPLLPATASPSCSPIFGRARCRRSCRTASPCGPARTRGACVAAARLTPGGVETAHPLPVLLRAPGPHSIRAVPPPPEPATRGFRRQRRERHPAARRCSRRRSPPRVLMAAAPSPGPAWPRAAVGDRDAPREPPDPSAPPRANHPDRPSLPMTRRQAAWWRPWDCESARGALNSDMLCAGAPAGESPSCPSFPAPSQPQRPTPRCLAGELVPRQPPGADELAQGVLGADVEQVVQLVDEVSGLGAVDERLGGCDEGAGTGEADAGRIRLRGAGLIFSSGNGRKWTEPPGKLQHDQVVPAQICRRSSNCASDHAHETHQLRARRLLMATPGLGRPLPDADLMPEELRAAIVLFASLLD